MWPAYVLAVLTLGRCTCVYYGICVLGNKRRNTRTKLPTAELTFSIYMVQDSGRGNCISFKAPLTLEINLCKLDSFARKFLVWTTFERNKCGNCISQFRTCSILRNFVLQKFHLWSALIGQSTSVYKYRMKSRRCSHMAFKSLFSMWMCSLLTETFRNFYFEIEFRNKFPTWKGPNNKNNTGTVLLLREFTWFIWWMQTERRVATNPQTKPTDLGCESAKNWQPPSTSTVAIYYCLAR